MRYSVISMLLKTARQGIRNQTGRGLVYPSKKILTVLRLLESKRLLRVEYQGSKIGLNPDRDLLEIKMIDKSHSFFNSRNLGKVFRMNLSSPYEALILSTPGGVLLHNQLPPGVGGVILGKIYTNRDMR